MAAVTKIHQINENIEMQKHVNHYTKLTQLL